MDSDGLSPVQKLFSQHIAITVQGRLLLFCVYTHFLSASILQRLAMLCPGCEFNFFFLDSGKCQKCKTRVGLSNTEVGALMVSCGPVSSSLTMCVFIQVP